MQEILHLKGCRLQVICVYEIILLSCVGAAYSSTKEPAKFTLSTLLDATMPVVRPLVAATSSRCESLKSIFGLTYTQMQAKNATDFENTLNIDLITKNGNTKYNLTATKRLYKVLQNATTVVILVHGFMESSDGLMVQGLSPELMKKPGFKTLALDGRKLINLEYFRSSTYVRFIGEILGNFIADLIRKGLDPAKVTLIGHSLGAHIAGVAGKRVREAVGTIGRIAALDPAGPCFSNVDSAGRLDSTDAVQVDVIHTNSGMLGYSDPVGTMDFYPNGGFTQPGCYLSVCDHSRAWEFFAESIASPKGFPARKCDSWQMFQDGLCSKNEVVYMGMNSEHGSPGLYFLTTASTAPFGMGPAGSG